MCEMLTYVRYAPLSHPATNRKDDLLSNFNWGGNNRVVSILLSISSLYWNQVIGEM